MFDYLFHKKGAELSLEDFEVSLQSFDEHGVNLVAPTIWSEHCLECSPPHCYKSCSVYKRRKDGRCVRIENGILPIEAEGKAEVNAGFCSYRRWAKVECAYADIVVPLEKVKRIYRQMLLIGSVFDSILNVLPAKPTKLVEFIYDVWYSSRRKLLRKFLSSKGTRAESLHLWISSYVARETRLILEIRNNANVYFRETIHLSDGKNVHFVPLPVLSGLEDAIVSLYPEEYDRSHDVMFNALEIVHRVAEVNEPSAVDKKRQMIKCVVWDLDNTLWQGVLVENAEIVPNERMISTVKFLDSKGIVNSVCSKNDYENANKKLVELEIRDYFVFPKINWHPKSGNIKQIAAEMNIALSSIAFVDDSPFERSEVKTECPDVMVIDAANIDAALESWRFQVQTSNESKSRRFTYQMMEKQQAEKELWKGDPDAFLLSCNMVLSIGYPKENELKRCHELIQRTNQLNISGQLLTYDEMVDSIKSEHQEAFVLKCKDKFGDYGIIGFSIIALTDISPKITDMFLSCRVANRKIELAFFLWLWNRYRKLGKIGLSVLYRKTERNTPIRLLLEKIVQGTMDESTSVEEYSIDIDKVISEKQVVTVMTDENVSRVE